jgi:purine-binding chemotaxis protein CheW
MSKSLAASKQLMKTYLSELLTEDSNEQSVARTTMVREKKAQPIEKLLNKVDLPKVATNDKPIIINTNRAEKSQPVADVTVAVGKDTKTKELTTHKSKGGFEAATRRNYREGDFQAMFFNVAGLIIAVPLIELGGIHKNDKTTTLMGKPDWFKGVMLHRDEKINVVDTARWVMPEKCDEKLLSSLNYQYIIMLNDSAWGLTAESLVDTVTLKQEDVKWLDSPEKRPWLAGLVKDRMCALLDVESLIKLLEKGVNITEE